MVSRWVRAEASIADENGTLAPVKIGACDLPVMFRLTQTADLASWTGAADDKAWLAFLGDVRRMAGREAPAQAIAVDPARPAPDNRLPLVAVIPFTQRGGDEEIEFLAEDLVEEITRQLAQRPFFETIGAGKMAAWRGKAIDYESLGRQLNARYLVEGKLQRAGEDVRLTVQLLDADSAKMVWSTRIARKLAEITAAPEDFAEAVATQLGENIILIEVNRAMASPGPHSAWDHLLRARAYTARPGSDSLRRQIEETRQALAAGSDIAFAHAFLVSSLSSLAWDHGERLDEAQIREIRIHMQRATQLDGDNPAILTMVVCCYHGLGEYENSLRLARRSLDLYPNYMASLHHVGLSLVLLGRTVDAIAIFTQQDFLTPFDAMRSSSLAWLGACYLLKGRPEDAEDALDRALALHPAYHLALKWKALAAARRGNEVEALAAIQQLREVEPTMGIEQHVWQIVRAPKLAERAAEHVATLRRLWEETEG